MYAIVSFLPYREKRIADNDFAQMRSIADRKNEAIAFRNLLSQILKEQGKRDV